MSETLQKLLKGRKDKNQTIVIVVGAMPKLVAPSSDLANKKARDVYDTIDT